MSLDGETQSEVSSALSVLPLVIELETAEGLVGLVHAECPFDDWNAFTSKLEAPAVDSRYLDQIIGLAQWSRNRIMNNFDGEVQGVRAVVVGHTPMRQMTSLGNTIFIDTMGWRDEGAFTILDAATLRPARKP
jgi:serine/threonine protein phosphatase 1